jgi:hypothetical protein
MSQKDLEQSFQEGVQAERERCAALTKFLRPETREVIARAVKEGKYLEDILDEALAALNAQPDRRAEPGRSP